jgi:hypothetical protein
MKKLIFASIISCLLAFGVSAQVVKKELTQAEIDKIIKNVSDKEGEFRQAFSSYSFTRKAIMQKIGMGGQITGEYRRDSGIAFNEKGERYEKILFAPMSTFPEITAEDIEDLGGVNAFALEPSAVSQYAFSYIGKEKIDELDLYVFDVTPKVMPDPKKSKLRLFQGRIWVDDQDLQLVKSKGKGVPETKENKFPIVEIWRENIDGKYWFPSLATANDELVFDSGEVLRIKMKVKYSGYNPGLSTVKVLNDDDPPLKTMTAPTPTPMPTPTPKKP